MFSKINEMKIKTTHMQSEKHSLQWQKEPISTEHTGKE